MPATDTPNATASPRAHNDDRPNSDNANAEDEAAKRARLKREVLQKSSILAQLGGEPQPTVNVWSSGEPESLDEALKRSAGVLPAIITASSDDLSKPPNPKRAHIVLRVTASLALPDAKASPTSPATRALSKAYAKALKAERVALLRCFDTALGDRAAPLNTTLALRHMRAQGKTTARVTALDTYPPAIKRAGACVEGVMQRVGDALGAQDAFNAQVTLNSTVTPRVQSGDGQPAIQ